MVSSGNPTAVIRLGQSLFALLRKLRYKSLIKVDISTINRRGAPRAQLHLCMHAIKRLHVECY